MNLQPRDYQADARNAILATWGERPWYVEGDTYRSCVLNLPTSAGKTIVAGMICEAVSQKGRFLYLADRDELCRQPLNKFQKLLGIRPDIDKAEEKASRMSRVVIGSVQTLSRESRLSRFDPDHFQYIFVDEAHRSVEQAKRITDYFSGAKVCGQTATAFRAKLKDLSAYYDTVAYELGVFDLIKEGYIVPIKVLTLPVQIDISDVRQKSGDYDADQLDTKIAPYYRRVADLLNEHCAGRQIVAFLPLIQSSKDFVEICRAAGITANHVDHTSSDRAMLQQRFEAREFQLISCSSLLSTGWDCPPCDTLLNLTPTRSTGLWRQKVGRILRVLPGIIEGIKFATERRAAIAASAKPHALILDLLFHAERFGLQGPADLIAANESERRAIQARLDENEEQELDLEDISEAVQADREAQLKEELERAARRKSDGLVDAEFYAAVMHDRELLDYEPVMKWHTEKVSEKQVAFLQRHGIDAATLKDRGHASALMSKIWGRRKLGLCSHRVVATLEAKGFHGAVHYSDDQAYRALGDDYPFPFGMPAKRKWSLGQVPPSYWNWLSEQPWVSQSWPLIWRHMQQIGVVNPAVNT